MIAPHIKWDHSEDHYVMRFEDCTEGRSAERKVPISLNDVEFDFIQGHCIDGNDRLICISNVNYTCDRSS
jgi:fatty acid synthase